MYVIQTETTYTLQVKQLCLTSHSHWPVQDEFCILWVISLELSPPENEESVRGLKITCTRSSLTSEMIPSWLSCVAVRIATVLVSIIIIIIIIIINPLTTRVVGAPQMILQPVFSIFPCSPPSAGTCRTPGLSIPWCCLPTSSFVRLVFFPLSLCLARWFYTTAVCVFLRSSGDLHVVLLPAGSWHGLPRW